MLSPNTICIGVKFVEKAAGCTGIGPVRAAAEGCLLEFWAPISGFDWCTIRREGEDFERERTPAMSLFVHCEQAGQNGAQTWYAFSGEKEWELFRKLLDVDGMGGKSAVKFLARVPYDVVLDLIARGDKEAFLKLPGAGPKTGPNMAAVLFKGAPPQPKTSAPPKVLVDEGAVQGLKSLGYQARPARDAVIEAQKNLPTDADTGAILRAALKSLAPIK